MQQPSICTAHLYAHQTMVIIPPAPPTASPLTRRSTVRLQHPHSTAASSSSITGSSELQLDWGWGSAALQLPLKPTLSANRKGQLDLQVQLASIAVQWGDGSSAQPLRARIHRTPALHPATGAAAHAAALAALYVLMPDALGPWMQQLAMPCSVAASAACLAKVAPAEVKRPMAELAAQLASWVRAAGWEDPAAATAGPGGCSSTGSSTDPASRSSGGVMLAAGRAALVTALYLYQRLQAASGEPSGHRLCPMPPCPSWPCITALQLH